MNTVEANFGQRQRNYPPVIMDENMEFEYLAGPDLTTPIPGADGFETFEFGEDNSIIGIRDGKRYLVDKDSGKIVSEIKDKPQAIAA